MSPTFYDPVRDTRQNHHCKENAKSKQIANYGPGSSNEQILRSQASQGQILPSVGPSQTAAAHKTQQSKRSIQAQLKNLIEILDLQEALVKYQYCNGAEA